MLTDVLNGIALGALLFILASGFSLTLGVARVINVAHGAFYMIAGYIAVSVAQLHGGFLLAVIVAACATALLGALVQRFVLRRLWHDPLLQVLSTYGVTVVAAEATRQIWGGYPEHLEPPHLLSGQVLLFGAEVTTYRLFLIGVSIALAVLLWYVIERTIVGARLRAVVDDGEMARVLGINLEVLLLGVFTSAGFLAGIAGALGGPIFGTYQGVQFDILTLTLVVVVMGGTGSLAGAFVGSLVVGLLYNVGIGLVPQFAYFILFGPMIAILVVRPRGLLGRRGSVATSL
jgi:branched-chain amino acid transport system permease protein